VKNSTTILVNTLAQYIRTGANVVLSLYATRLILEALGSNQYGIYTLVGGIVSMISFFTNALTTTTQRYLSYNTSKQNIEILKSYFFNSLIIHVFFGTILLGVLLIVQPLLFSGFLNIDPQFINAAKDVFLAVVFMLFIAMLTSPYRAILISRENIVYLSFVDVCDGILKLIIGFSLFYFEENRLIWYAILMTSVSIFNLLSLSLYSIIRFPESRAFKIYYISRIKIKELTFFAGWTIYGTLCLFGRVQGVAIVLNKFFSTTVNAAYGISLQINSALGAISSALQTAIAPQLIKSEGASNRDKMLMLSETGCKISFILLSIVGFPIIFNIDYVLVLWLGKVPEYSSFFCIILILSNLVDQLTIGFISSMNAIGKIKSYNLIINTLKLSTTFILAILLYLGIPLKIAFFSYVIIEAIGSAIRLILCHNATGLKIGSYISRVLCRLFIPTLVIIFANWTIGIFTTVLWSKILFVFAATTLYLGVIYWIGLNTSEKAIINSLLKRL